MKLIKILSVAMLAAGIVSQSASADEKIRYRYDALGRLEKVTDDSGPNAGAASTFDYDRASNRLRYRISKGQPAGTNRPPVAKADVLAVQCTRSASVNVVANDTDPDNDTPLTVVSVTKISGTSYDNAYVSSASTITASVGPDAGEIAEYDYVVRDPGGATAVGRLTVRTYGRPPMCTNLY